ncbi:hypothetical protein CHS0354_037674 [Potamilus streckersoni]|uniref:26S proteasome non-ATPase regulatory subunit 4 n=1 Tax=Potamilus streckersoni TaxID=2493646 RepID=A0AAE0T185_9BIVA|nr:hypothetical protein CHS0354_037674 [Potamilus streckersoni]
MVLESTIVCFDNSDYMRNGDFVPTRLQAQQDAVNLICHSKTRSNPENNVGLLVMSSTEVLTTLTTDVGRILSKLHQVQPKGTIRFATSIRIAHLALKHRQGRNHKLRIIVFVGSPIEDDKKELVKLAKKLKKEKVNVDVINFGEEALNTEKLTEFINTINGKDGTSSHLVTVPPGPLLSEALVNSPVVVGEDGSGAPMHAVGFEFGVDPNEDPELALALRVSMEEQRARQEEESRKAAASSVAESGKAQEGEASNDEAMLEKALAMSMHHDSADQTPSVPDFSSMSEEEQIAYAMQMSLQNSAANTTENTPVPMDVVEGGKEFTLSRSEDKDEELAEEEEEEEDYSEVMNDPEFLQSVLENLPGVDPKSEAIQSAVSSLTKKEDKDKDKDKK